MGDSVRKPEWNRDDNTHTHTLRAGKGWLGCFELRQTGLARELPGGNFLLGEELLMGAVTIPKLEFNPLWLAWSQQVAICLWLQLRAMGADREQCAR